MKRPLAYWHWLLADVSLDRATGVLPALGFPPVDHAALQRCLGPDGPSAAMPAPERVQQRLQAELGPAAAPVSAWLEAFPFTADSSCPAWFYWDARLADLLANDPPPAPGGLGPGVWEAVVRAYAGQFPAAPAAPAAEGWTAALHAAAQARAALRTTNARIEHARRERLTPHDLEVYLRWGWNDDGTQRGLASLQIGARLEATRGFWMAIAPHVPAAVFEDLAQARDRAEWRAAARPEDFAADARRYGVPAEQMAAEVFPPPAPPPPLDQAFSC